jgi:hypothetical protein
MASCFLCGSVEESEVWFESEEIFTNLIFDFITSNDIRTIYTLSRNIFDDIVEDALNDTKDRHNAELVKVVYDKSPAVSLNVRLSSFRWNGEIVCPIDDVIDPMITYRTLYKWTVDNSNYMLTYYIDDSDITINVLEMAQKKGVKIYNLAKHLSHIQSQLHDNVIPFKKRTD